MCFGNRERGGGGGGGGTFFQCLSGTGYIPLYKF